MRHIHLDPVGGLAGDMFVAALLDAFPALAEGAVAAAESLAPVRCRLVSHRDHALAGRRFKVHEIHARDHHTHVHWREIRDRISQSALAPSVKHRAIGIFAGLAEAEAQVHGVAPADIEFHEVGAADSIADIVGAAWLIDAIGPAGWSVAPLPMGSGMVRTAHGMLPVPAPATARLLQGFMMHDDGVPGERVTPTGAAILKHLAPAAREAGLRLSGTGIGFGTRTLPGLSNCLRALVFDRDHAAPAPGVPHRTLLVVTFEVDDQSAEDLAVGLDFLRAAPGVHDVLSMPAFGKKGRMTTHIQILAAPAEEEAVVAAAFAQTTTIGLRTQLVSARALPRQMARALFDGHEVRVKRVERPGGFTAKAELDDIAKAETHAGRQALRRRAEDEAE